MKPLRIFLGRVGARDVAQNNLAPPVGLLYLAAYIGQRFDVEFRIVDQRLEQWSNEQFAREIVAFEPDIVGLGCVTMSAHLLPDLVTKIRSGLPEALVVLGGPHASAGGAQAVEDAGADVAVAGEGERIFELVIETYLDGCDGKGRDLSGVPGLLWRDPDGQVIINPGKIPYIEDLDFLPMPAYDLIDVSRYWSVPSSVVMPARKYVTLVTSRGCPFLCNYCHNVFGKRFRGHSPERVVDEIEHHVREFGIEDVEFMDDVFNYDHDRAIEICELIQKRNLRIRLALPNGVRSDILSEELMDALVDSGLYFCSFALESASPRIQKLMGKRLNIPAFLESVKMAADRGVFANGFSMLGFPGETEEELKLTVDTMCASRLHVGQFMTVTPFPGNDLFDEVSRTMPERLAGINFSDTTYYTIRVNLSAVPDDVLFGYQRRAYRRFYLNPLRMLRILRAHPSPLYLFSYVPLYLQRATRGVFDRS